ncbi:MAG: prephenate dehydrogenase/arogenate dehydrogenase family protein [Leptospirales bacterium]|nr:prephenate dehydrogenase/arogenate dehydrogenase family protein [Leptospirales bacterium]
MKPQSILILGMGMMGASLALAARKRWPTVRLDGVVRSESSRRWIEDQRMADRAIAASGVEALGALQLDSYDLIVLALPLGAVRALAPVFPQCSSLITDMSSARREVDQAFALRSDLRFVGSHPMCGSENRGPSAASSDLYVDRLCLISKDSGAYPGGESAAGADRQLIAEFWQELGMRICLLPAELHDQTLAYLSHAPHVLSGILARWAQAAPSVEQSLALAPMPITGGGFKGMARIAGSNPEMWRDVLVANRQAVLHSLRDFQDQLGEIIVQLQRSPLDEDWWMQWFAAARRDRNRLCGFQEDE